MEIFPALDLLGGKVVRLLRGRKDCRIVYSEDPIAVAQSWRAQGARQLHVVDLDGAFQGEPRQLHLLREIVNATGLPVQVGGGLRDWAAVEAALEAGARWVILGTLAVENPDLLARLVGHFGKDRIGVALDARKSRVVTRGWLQEGGQTVAELARRLKALGVGRFLYTDVEADGTLGGVNIAEIAQVVGLVPALWIVSGGVGRREDLEALAGLSELHGVIVGRALYEGRVTLQECLSLATPS